MNRILVVRGRVNEDGGQQIKCLYLGY